MLRGSSRDAIFIEDERHHIVIEDNDISDWGSLSKATWREGGQTKSYVSRTIGVNHQAAVRALGKSQRVKVSQIVIQNNVIHDPSHGSNHWGQCSLGPAQSKGGGSRDAKPNCRCTNTTDLTRAQTRCDHDGQGSLERGINHPGGPQVFDMTNSDGNHVVRYNTVYATSEDKYFNDIFGGSSTNNSARGYPGPDSDFYGNYAANCWDNGFEMEGGRAERARVGQLCGQVL